MLRGNVTRRRDGGQQPCQPLERTVAPLVDVLDDDLVRFVSICRFETLIWCSLTSMKRPRAPVMIPINTNINQRMNVVPVKPHTLRPSLRLSR